MSEYKQYIEVESGSEKNFGIVFAVVFLLISLYPLVDNKDVHLWSLIISLIFFLLAYVDPKVLSVPNKLWFKLGMALGAVVAPVVMALVYFSTVVPIGLIMRLMGKDLLRQKLDKNTKSYWIERNEPMGSMKDQF
jgi:hypothetical protein|tara:strand:- start:1385 stop:1789 length:405 start_codon:yes stop_codon:yes gene_type:complete